MDVAVKRSNEVAEVAAALKKLLHSSKSENISRFLEEELRKVQAIDKCSGEELAAAITSNEADLAEIQDLSAGQSSTVYHILNKYAMGLQHEINLQRKKQDFLGGAAPRPASPAGEGETSTSPSSPTPEATPSRPAIPVIPEQFQQLQYFALQRWAWDQSNSFVTVYLTLDGLVEQSQVHCSFQKSALDFRCINCNGKHYRLAVPTLCEEVVPDACSVVVKPNSAKIKLRKAQTLEWLGLDDTEKRKKAQHKRLADSGATTHELLRHMYEQADDKTREELAKSAAEGQRKRDEQAKAAGLI